MEEGADAGGGQGTATPERGRCSGSSSESSIAATWWAPCDGDGVERKAAHRRALTVIRSELLRLWTTDRAPVDGRPRATHSMPAPLPPPPTSTAGSSWHTPCVQNRCRRRPQRRAGSAWREHLLRKWESEGRWTQQNEGREHMYAHKHWTPKSVERWQGIAGVHKNKIQAGAGGGGGERWWGRQVHTQKASTIE